MATDEISSKAVQVSSQGSSAPAVPTPAQQRAAQHQGTTDTDVLVRDIEKTREELAVTIDEIVDRVSPKKVVERTKQQASEAAKQGVHDATVILKETATVVREKAAVAGELLKEKTGTATEAVKGAAATAKERVSGTGDAHPDSSPLTGATSVEVRSATPVASTPAPAGGAPSPLPAGTVSVDAGALPPPEPGGTPGSLADAAERSGTSSRRSGAPSAAPLRAGELPPSRVPVFAGAGVAAALALLLLLLRRRNR